MIHPCTLALNGHGRVRIQKVMSLTDDELVTLAQLAGIPLDRHVWHEIVRRQLNYDLEALLLAERHLEKTRK